MLIRERSSTTGAGGGFRWGTPAVAAGCVVGVLLVDLVLAVAQPGYAVRGLLDEPAHVMTAALALTAISSLAPHALGTGARVATLAASTLIDLDHVPAAVLGSSFLTAGTPRPYPHSLLTVLGLVALALLARRRPRLRAACAGAALGVALHLFRDLATGQVALWWPAAGNVHLPFGWYAAGLALAALVTATARPVLARTGS